MAKKILIVDDEPSVVMLMKRRIEHLGYVLVTASNGQEGLDKTRKEKPDLVILDNTMPKMSGLEMCKQLKSDPAIQATPVLIYTANTEKGIEENFILAGAVGVIYKPSMADLMSLAKRILAGEKIEWGKYEED